MKTHPNLKNISTKTPLVLELVVFTLVSAAFTNVYITQPIQPALGEYFHVTPVEVSLTVSMVIWGIVASNLFFGYLSDRVSLHPIILAGGFFVAMGSVICGLTESFTVLIGARFFQGLFIPALTTSLSAWLARNLPPKNLSVVMGSYVSATVLGALGGRLLGGWIFSGSNWRYSFYSAAFMTIATTLFAVTVLPDTNPVADANKKNSETKTVEEDSFWSILKRRELLLIFGCGAGSLMAFSPLLNFLPYRLKGPPFNYSTKEITMVYLVYALGIFIGPVAGRIRNRLGAGNALIGGTLFLGCSLVLLLYPSLPAIIVGLTGACAGFFTVHAVAVGMLNGKLSKGHGKANALYILFYYTGGALGISLAGIAFEISGWAGVIGVLSMALIFPLVTGLVERVREQEQPV